MKKVALCILLLVGTAFALPKIHITNVSSNAPVTAPASGIVMTLNIPAGTYLLSANFQVQSGGACVISDVNGVIVNTGSQFYGQAIPSGVNGTMAMSQAVHFTAADTINVVCNPGDKLGSGSLSALQINATIDQQ